MHVRKNNIEYLCGRHNIRWMMHCVAFHTTSNLFERERMRKSKVSGPQPYCTQAYVIVLKWKCRSVQIAGTKCWWLNGHFSLSFSFSLSARPQPPISLEFVCVSHLQNVSGMHDGGNSIRNKTIPYDLLSKNLYTRTHFVVYLHIQSTSRDRMWTLKCSQQFQFSFPITKNYKYIIETLDRFSFEWVSDLFENV